MTTSIINEAQKIMDGNTDKEILRTCVKIKNRDIVNKSRNLSHVGIYYRLVFTVQPPWMFYT